MVCMEKPRPVTRQLHCRRCYTGVGDLMGDLRAANTTHNSHDCCVRAMAKLIRGGGDWSGRYCWIGKGVAFRQGCFGSMVPSEGSRLPAEGTPGAPSRLFDPNLCYVHSAIRNLRASPFQSFQKPVYLFVFSLQDFAQDENLPTAIGASLVH